MQKTKIEWTRGPNGEPGYTWNPIKGLCPVGCWYCYARRMYMRFGWPSEISLDTDPIELYGRVPDGSRIFVCSTMEIFHPEVPPSYRDFIFQNIKDYPKLTFIILTKLPENIDRPMPDNVWLGVTITGEGQDIYRWLDLEKAKARVKFISFEPILAPMHLVADHCPEIPAWTIWGGLTGYGKNWTIWGGLTGYGKKRSWFDRRILFDGVDFFKKVGSKIFIKNNLREIWGKKLIQEFPDE